MGSDNVMKNENIKISFVIQFFTQQKRDAWTYTNAEHHIDSPDWLVASFVEQATKVIRCNEMNHFKWWCESMRKGCQRTVTVCTNNITCHRFIKFHSMVHIVPTVRNHQHLNELIIFAVQLHSDQINHFH